MSFDLQEFLPYQLNQLAERVSVALSRIYVDEFGISVAEWRVMATLSAADGLRASDIVSSTRMDKVRVSRAVSALERRALLARQRSARDQRAAELTLTDRGRALFAEIAPRAEAWEAKLLAPLSAHQHQQIRASLTLLRGCIDQLEQDG